MTFNRANSQRSPTPAHGFTLLEILVALAIITIALGAIISESSRNGDNAARLRDHTIAHWVAMNLVAEQQIGGKWPAITNTRGHTLMAEQQWFWRLRVSKTADTRIRRLDVVVSNNERRDSPQASLIAYIGQPTP